MGPGHNTVASSLPAWGGNFPWQEPADLDTWVANAVTSLSNLLETYSLDGVDVNYEQGIGGSFVEAIGRVATGLKQQDRDAVLSVAPYSGTYQSLYEEYGESIYWINYQAYAENGLDKQGYLDLFDRLAQVTGYDKYGQTAKATRPHRQVDEDSRDRPEFQSDRPEVGGMERLKRRSYRSRRVAGKVSFGSYGRCQPDRAG